MITKTRRLRIKNREDAWSSVFFIVLGIAAAIYSLTHYRLGVPSRMGPGFFPAMIGGVVALFGVIVLITSTGIDDGPAAEPAGDWKRVIRPLAAIICAVIAFGLLLQPLGLIASVVVLIVIARIARWGTLRELVALCGVLVLIAYLVFVVGLNMPFRLVP
jgi:hypothetical protein